MTPRSGWSSAINPARHRHHHRRRRGCRSGRHSSLPRAATSMPDREPSLGVSTGRYHRRNVAPIADRALKLLAGARTPEAVRAAVELLGDDHPQLRPALLDRYAALAANPYRLDQGAHVRAEIVRSLRPMITHADIPFLEDAAAVYERLPPSKEDVAGGLRGAALTVLSQVDDRLASFHAARMLGDASRFSEEPGLTAVRVLAALGNVTALYAYLQTPADGERCAEALRAMIDAPPSAVKHLIELYGSASDQVQLLGLFDLLLARSDRDDYIAFIADFLRSSKQLELCRSVATTIVAEQYPRLVEMLRDVQASTHDRRLADAYTEALALR